jgi:hypothetical protein
MSDQGPRDVARWNRTVTAACLVALALAALAFAYAVGEGAP